MVDKMTAQQVAEGVRQLQGWTADADAAITRTFKFADHITAIGFVTRVAMAAEVLDHHPDLHIVYNTVDITLNTHSAGGVTEKDFELAKKIDHYA